MPNHIKNRITAPEGVLSQYVAEGEKGTTFDFAKIIPPPALLVQDGVSCGTKMVAELALGLIDLSKPSAMPADPMANMRAATDALHKSNATRQLIEGPMAKDLSDEDFELMVQLMRSYRESKHLSWLEWNIANWGTKWNAYEVEIVSPGVLKFETAWSAPHPVIEKLASLAGLGLKHEWADEDTGSNVGWRIYGDNGLPVEQKELSGQKSGYELAFDLHGDGDQYRWDESEGTYVWVDEDEDA